MTAVEWLVNQLQKAEYIPEDSLIMNYVIQQAKEMEKQQIKTSFTDGFLNNDKNSEQYYNETFKNK